MNKTTNVLCLRLQAYRSISRVLRIKPLEFPKVVVAVFSASFSFLFFFEFIRLFPAPLKVWVCPWSTVVAVQQYASSNFVHRYLPARCNNFFNTPIPAAFPISKGVGIASTTRYRVSW